VVRRTQKKKALALFCGLPAAAAILLFAGCGGANTPPEASAVAAEIAFAGHPAHLDGTASSDLDQDELTYTWSLDARPEGSAAGLSSADKPTTSLVGDVRGDYAVSLVVNDGQSYSEASRQAVTVQPWFSLADPSVATLPWDSDVSHRPGAISGQGEPRVSNSTDPLTGAAWGDYDGDGDHDLYVATASIDFFTETSSYLYQNNGDGTFTYMADTGGAAFKVTPKMPVGHSPPVIVVGNATRSVLWGDYDGDGDLDLFAANSGNLNKGNKEFLGTRTNFLYRNVDPGAGVFTNAEVEAGLADERFAMGAAWGDYDNDGDLDLAVANHAKIERDEEKKVHWLNEAGAIYRNNGDGTFTDVAPDLGILQDPITLKEEWDIATVKCGSPWQPFWFDYDGDGDQDIFYTCETGSGTNLLYRNSGDGTFADVTREAGLWESTGHGVDAGDYDRDGDPDLIVTDTGTNHLWQNNGNGSFTEVTSAAGVAGRGGVGWGTAFFDFDNDGDLDIGVAAGDWTTYGDFEERKRYNANLLYENKGDGTFEDVSEESGLDLVPARGIWMPSISRGLALADYDDDGALDVYFTSSDDWNYLHRNDIAGYLGNNWLKVKLQGTESNTFGIGALVTVKSGDTRLTEQLFAGGSFLSMDAPELHFGLGDNTVVSEIEVRWPSGIIQIVRDVEANQTITITES